MTPDKPKRYATDQERFWAGDFGSQYIQRNQGELLNAANLNFFAHALGRAGAIRNLIEFGANIGMNLKALRQFYPTASMHGIEINPDAAKRLAEVIPTKHIFAGSILEFEPTQSWDLVLIKGVLIHLHPDVLPQVYDKLVEACGRYLLVAEYYNPVPVSIPYRGHGERLFKRDFAGELLDRHANLRLVDYGFAYHRDPAFPQDDITWFLLEKHTDLRS